MSKRLNCAEPDDMLWRFNITFKHLNFEDTVFDGRLFDPLQLWLHLFGVLTEVHALETHRGWTSGTMVAKQKTY